MAIVVEIKKNIYIFCLYIFFLVINDGNPLENNNFQNISYDVSKLVDFPGFNIPAPQRTRDVSAYLFNNILLELWIKSSHFKTCLFSNQDFLQYGSVPMQSAHMKQNFAAYLSNNFPQVISSVATQSCFFSVIKCSYL